MGPLDTQKFFRQFGISVSLEEATEFDEETKKITTKILKARPDLNPDTYFSKTGMHVAFSPASLINSLQKFIKDGTPDLVKRKKFAEEIFPTIEFVFALKLLGLGEYYIVSKDAPDILLVSPTSSTSTRTLGFSVPVEVLRIPERALSNDADTGDIAKFIIEKKFNKRYEKNTVLLVTLDAQTLLNLPPLAFLLENAGSPFMQIWLHGQMNEDVAMVSSLLPYIVMVPVSASMLPKGIAF